MQKNLLFQLFLLISLTLFSGCGEKSVSSIAKGMENALGIEVVLKTNEKDTCMKNQLFKFSKDFSELSSKDRENIIASAKSKLKKITLFPTQINLIKKGELGILALIGKNGTDSENYGEIGGVYKSIYNSITMSYRKGSTSRLQTLTQIEENGNLNFQIYSMYTNTKTKLFQTNDTVSFSEIPESMESTASLDFLNNLYSKKIFFKLEKNEVGEKCGETLSLDQFIDRVNPLFFGNFVEEIKDENYDQKTATGLSIVDHYADWCGPCKEFSLTLRKSAQKYKKHIHFYKYNTGNNELHFPQAIPYITFMKDGKVIADATGAMSSAEFEEKIKKYLLK